MTSRIGGLRSLTHDAATTTVRLGESSRLDYCSHPDMLSISLPLPLPSLLGDDIGPKISIWSPVGHSRRGIMSAIHCLGMKRPV